MFEFLKNALGFNNTNKQEVGSFEDTRVTWAPPAPKAGDNLHINYQGLLKNSGASDVYLHYGFDSWSKGVTTVKMERMVDGDFGSDIQFSGDQEINFCFKDGSNHWDNNDGHNWTAHLH